MLDLCQNLDIASTSILGEATDAESPHRVAQAFDVISRAHAKRKLPARLYSRIADFLVDGGRALEANRIVNEICSETNDPSLWMKKIELFSLFSATDLVKPTKTEGRDLFLTVLKSVDSMTKEEERKFWRLWMEYAIFHNKKVMAKKIVTSHSVKSSSKAISDVLSVYLKWSAACEGIEPTFKVSIQEFFCFISIFILINLRKMSEALSIK